jgi:thiol-disulfide isomerase/thioredoxin
LALLAGILAIGAVLGVLYVILSAPVHAVADVPEALARLKPLDAPQIAPAVAITDEKGDRLMLSAFRGRYVLVNLWATWCGPCVRELPALSGLEAAVPQSRLKVLAVNVGRSGAEETAQFLKAHKAAHLGVWLDTQVALVRAFKAYGLPTSVLIDPDGKVVARAVGASDWSAPSAIAYFQNLPLAKPAPHSGKPGA